jgi:hypothetical protein
MMGTLLQTVRRHSITILLGIGWVLLGYMTALGEQMDLVLFFGAIQVALTAVIYYNRATIYDNSQHPIDDYS